DRRAARVAGALGDVAQAEQIALVDIGIVLGPALRIGKVTRPAHEMRDRPGRPVAIEHLEAETTCSNLPLHPGECRRRLPRHETPRLFVAVDPPSDEIIDAEITHVDDKPVDHARGIDELGWHRPRARRKRHHAPEDQPARGGGAHGKVHGNWLAFMGAAAIPAADGCMRAARCRPCYLPRRSARRRTRMRALTMASIALATAMAPATTVAQHEHEEARPALTGGYAPRLGELMILQQIRHSKLWFAVAANNWEL